MTLTGVTLRVIVRPMKKQSLLLWVPILGLLNLHCGKSLSVRLKADAVSPNDSMNLKVADTQDPTPIKLSFLLTNDIHGHIEPNLTYLSTMAQQLRDLPEYKNNHSALFVLDSGDQFQGTLQSNYDEGESVFKILNQIGYDAAVPGNHDYDFGPLGWLYDKVSTGNTSDNPREVIEKLANMAKFPLLSANTYFKNSIKVNGLPIAVDDQCKPSTQSLKDGIDYSLATGPAFLKPYTIISRAGVRVALIGLDNPSTPSTTTKENISDLCFRDELETYLEIRKSLEGRADVFVLMIHDGNSENSFDASNLAQKINAARDDGVQLVAAGHTHFIHNAIAGGVHVIQDGANGKAYGRADLYFDPISKKIISEKSDTAAGVAINKDTCDNPKAAFACSQLSLPLASDARVDQVLNESAAKIAPLAKKKVATASETIRVDRISESPLGNILTDALRKATGTQVALMNTGGIRAPIQKGEVLYENLFEVLPFQNQAVVIQSLSWKTLKTALEYAIKTCGRYGTLVQSGLKIQYARECKKNGQDVDVDYSAKLVRVETLDGKALLDPSQGIDTSAEETLSVATLDFIAAGGSGYQMFSGVKIDSTPGIARELIVSALSSDRPILNAQIDGRLKNTVEPKPKP